MTVLHIHMDGLVTISMVALGKQTHTTITCPHASPLCNHPTIIFSGYFA